MRRNVYVRNCDVDASDVDFDDDGFRRREKRRREFDVGDSVVDEGDETATTSRRPVAPNNCISWKWRGFGSRRKFSFLNAGNFNLPRMQKPAQFRRRILETITVPGDDSS